MKTKIFNKESLKIVICLGVIALVASLLLASVNLFTQVDEQAQMEKAIGSAYAESQITDSLDVSGYDNAKVAGTKLLGAYKAADGAYVILMHVEKADKICYNAEGISVIVVFKDERIVKVVGYSHSETPGLGANALKEKHLDQYKGIHVANLCGEGLSGLDADYPEFSPNKVTSATYSTNGVNRAVKAAARAYVTLQGGADNG